MTKSKGGRPRKYNTDGTKFVPQEPSYEDTLEVEDDVYVKPIEVKEAKIMTNKAGKFIVVNTVGLQGLRINLDRISSYSPNSDKSIGIAWDNSTLGTTLKFGTPEEMLAVLEQMDGSCL